MSSNKLRYKFICADHFVKEDILQRKLTVTATPIPYSFREEHRTFSETSGLFQNHQLPSPSLPVKFSLVPRKRNTFVWGRSWILGSSYRLVPKAKRKLEYRLIRNGPLVPGALQYLSPWQECDCITRQIQVSFLMKSNSPINIQIFKI